MRKVKLCCFTVNYTHACIIANNFINKELKNVKVEESEIMLFYSKLYTCVYYSK